ncbi:MAG: alpha-galactosidase [Pelolinea sp.]|nr:alpha-galactosidase [Pelolinea sp.]
MPVLENRDFHVSNEKQTGIINILSKIDNIPLLINNNMAASGRFLSGDKFWLEINLFRSSIPTQFKSDQSRSLHFSGLDEKIKIGWEVEFKLDEVRPIVLWRLSIKNFSESPVFIDKLFLLKPKTSTQSNLEKSPPGTAEDLRFYSHGWQSWSYSGAYRADDRMRRTHLGFLHEPMVMNPGTPSYTKKGEFSSDFFAVVGDAVSRKGIVVGFLSQVQHFGTISTCLKESPQIKMWANGDDARLCSMDEMTTDWAVLSTCCLSDSNSLSSYLDAVAEQHDITDISPPQTGWCSWYYYYQDISQMIIEENLEVLKNIRRDVPFDLIQIDDGYQKEVGDWLEFNNKFPAGVRGLARNIKQSGFMPGIWLAPFILHPRSQTVKDHPEWVLRKKNKRPVRAGFVWNDLGMALDLTAPGVLDHVHNVISTAVNEWGFQYLKLDFLYAAALDGKYFDDTKTRAQVLKLGMETIREAAGEGTMLLGCGVPLGSALGLVDNMRIGADVSSHWKPTYFNISFPFKNEPHMPSAENSINNIITRSFLHNRWWVNDPDCLLVREDSSLSLLEIQTLATVIALTGGAVLLSDNMAALSEDRLQIVKALIPPINKQAHVIDWMESGTPNRMRIDLVGAVGSWHLVSFSNWEDQFINISFKSEMFGMPDAAYIVSSFWNHKTWMCEQRFPLFVGTIQPHETVLLAVRKQTKNNISYIGSDLHISQGLEVENLQIENNEIKLQFSDHKRLYGHIDFMLPGKPKETTHNGKKVDWIMVNNAIYRFMVDDDPGLFSITY